MHPPTPKKDAPHKKRSKKKKALATVPPKSNGLHPGGRPSKQSPQTIDTLAQCVADGLTDEESASIAGIDDLTLTRWRKQPEFCRAIRLASALRTQKRLKRIEYGERGWQGTAWFLERREPARFARPEIQSQVNVQVNNTTNTTNVLSANADALRQLLSSPALADDSTGLPAPTPDDVP
jgi:hypothetical protein